MPRYSLKEKGFFHGRLYDPEGKRKILDVDKPFPKGKKPSWVGDVVKESAAAKKNREAQETARAAAEADQNEDDQKDIGDASFLGDGESASAVETL